MDSFSKASDDALVQAIEDTASDFATAIKELTRFRQVLKERELWSAVQEVDESVSTLECITEGNKPPLRDHTA